MPQAVVPFIAAALGGGAIAGAVANLLVGVAFSALSTAVMSQDRSVTARRPGIRTEFTGTGDVTPQSVILGRYATPGFKMGPDYAHSQRAPKDDEPLAPDPFYGAIGKGKILTMIRSLSDAPVAGLTGIYVDGVRFDYPADFEPRAKYGMAPKATLAAEKVQYRNSMSVEFFDGTQEAPSEYLRGAYGNHPKRPWGEDAVHRGAAYVIVSFDLDYDLFTSKPELLFEVDGLPLLDPRDGTVKATNNPAVMAWNLYQTITVGADRYGVGLPRAYLPDAVWRTAMNVCDVQVPDGDGGTEAQYRCGYEIKIAQPEQGGDEPLDVIDVLLRAMAGQVAEVGGNIHVRAGAPGLPIAAMTDDDILGSEPEAHSPIVGISGIYNSVAAQYPSPADKWATRDAKTVVDADAVTRLGEVRQGGVDLSCVPYSNQVRRLMKAWLDDAQRHRAHTFTLPGRWAALLTPLAVFAWSSDAYAYTNKLFEVQEAVHDVATGQVAVVVREVDPDDWDVGNAEIAPITVAAPQPTFIAPFDLGTLVLTPAIAVDANGVARRPGIRAEWDAEGRNLGSVTVEYRLRGTTGIAVTDTTADGPSGGLTTFDGILPNTEYEGHAKGIVRGSSIWTDWVPVTTPDVGFTEADLGRTIRDKLQDIEDVRDLILLGFVNAGEANDKADKIVEDLEVNLGPLNEAIDAAMGEIEEARAIVATIGDGVVESIADAHTQIDAIQVDLADARTTLGGSLDSLRADIEATELVTISRLDAVGVQVSTEAGARSEADLALGVRIDTVSVELGGNIALITFETAARITADESLASRIDTVAAQFGDATGSIVEQYTVLADATQVIAQRLDTIEVDFGPTNALIESERLARANADVALASEIDSLTVQVGDVNARVTSQSLAWADADEVLAQRIDALVVEAGDGTGTVQDEALARADADLALGARITAVTATFNDNKSVVNTQLVALSDKDKAIGARIDTVVASVEMADARITSESISTANALGSISSRVDTVESSFGSLNERATVSDFQANGQFWTQSLEGSPESKASLLPEWTFALDPARGRYASLKLPVPGNRHLASRAYTKAVPGRTYRLTIVARHVGAFPGGPGVRVQWRKLKTDFTTLATTQGADLVFSAANVWQTFTREFVFTGADAPWLLGFVYVGPGYGTTANKIDVAYLDVRDIDELADARAAITEERIARTAENLALTQRADIIGAAVGTVDARVSSQALARATADEGLGQRIDNVIAYVGDTNARITNSNTVFANADVAITQSVNTLSGRVGTAESTITQQAQTITTQAATMASLRTELNATTGKANANITKVDQVVTDLDGFASAYSGVTVRTQGGGVAGFLATSFTNPDGTGGAVLDLLGDAVRAGTILTDKLAVGQGRNLLEDSEFSQGARMWRIGREGTVGTQSVLAVVPAGQPYSGLADPVMSLRQYGTGTTGSAYAFARGVDPATQLQTDQAIACTEGEVFFGSARTLAVACTGQIGIRFFDSQLNSIRTVRSDFGASAAEPNRPPRRWLRRIVKATAPAGAAYAQLFLQKDGRSAGTVSALYWYQPQLEETHASASEPTPYGRGGVTLIDGGQFVTGTLYADAANISSFSAAGLAIFGGGLQSSGFTPGMNGKGWEINNNGDATFGTLQLREGTATRTQTADYVVSNGNFATYYFNINCLGNTLILAFIDYEMSRIGDNSPYSIVYAPTGAELWSQGGDAGGGTYVRFLSQPGNNRFTINMKSAGPPNRLTFTTLELRR